MSHTLANLRARLHRPAPWAERCAAKIHLVHRITSSNVEHSFEAIADSKFPDPAVLREASSLDKKLKRRPAVYFFVGVLYPGGSLRNAFLFGPDSDGSLSGISTPFDSGGILEKHCLACARSEADKVQYLRDHECDVSQFREYLAFCLTAYYESVEAYLAARPKAAIDDCKTVEEMKIHTCAFEVRHEATFHFPKSTRVLIHHTDRKRVERAADEARNLSAFPEVEYVSNLPKRVGEAIREALQ